jgi:hypothetical protein
VRPHAGSRLKDGIPVTTFAAKTVMVSESFEQSGFIPAVLTNKEANRTREPKAVERGDRGNPNAFTQESDGLQHSLDIQSEAE